MRQRCLVLFIFLVATILGQFALATSAQTRSRAIAAETKAAATVNTETKTRTPKPALVWQPGEQLVYSVKWNDLSAAKVIMATDTHSEDKAEKDAYRVEVKVNTIGVVRNIVQVKDRFTAFVNGSTGLPFRAEREILEGPRNETGVTIFDQEKHTAKVADNSPIAIPAQTHDIASLFWAIRNLDLKPGDSEKMQVFNSADKKMFVTEVEAGKQQEVSTSAGKFTARELIVRLQDPKDPKLITDKYQIRFWVTDDARKLPVLITAQPPFGKVRMELTPTANKTDNTENPASQPTTNQTPADAPASDKN